MDICIGTHACTQRHTDTHAHKDIHRYTSTHGHRHVCMHTHMQTHIRTPAQHIHARVNTHPHLVIHIHMHTQAHTHTHTHTQQSQSYQVQIKFQYTYLTNLFCTRDGMLLHVACFVLPCVVSHEKSHSPTISISLHMISLKAGKNSLCSSRRLITLHEHNDNDIGYRSNNAAITNAYMVELLNIIRIFRNENCLRCKKWTELQVRWSCYL